MSNRKAIDACVQEALDAMRGEERKKIDGYDYKISNYGRIRSLDRYVTDKNGDQKFVFGQDICFSRAGDGHIKVNLSGSKGRKSIMVSRLVYKYFVGDIDVIGGTPYVMHKDWDIENNRRDNLKIYDGDLKKLNGKVRRLLRKMIDKGLSEDDIMSIAMKEGNGGDYMYYIDKFLLHDNTERPLDEITLKEFLEFHQKTSP